MSFTRASREEELLLVTSAEPTFSKLKQYLAPLITDALGRFELTEEQRQMLSTQLDEDVTLAAQRFLSDNVNRREYSFSVYFTWYIEQRINHLPYLKRKE